MPGCRYDEHRFDNYGAWIEREGRLNAQAQGRPLGYGYAEPKAPVPPPEEKPFYVQEAAFTSGLLVNRKYDQNKLTYSTGQMRGDPWHYPNMQDLRDEDHFKDWRRRTQHTDPRRWQVDPELRAAVPDKMVQQHVAKEKGELRANLDPRKVAMLFSNDIRLDQDLQPREAGGAAPRPGVRTPGRPAGPVGGAGGVGAAADSGSRWSWCFGRRKPIGSEEFNHTEREMLKARSLPQLSLTGASTLSGNEGGPPSAFYGDFTRKFGEHTFDGRMRGGQKARDGFAGTFPNVEAGR